jgi:mannose-6-phosphate isomerase
MDNLQKSLLELIEDDPKGSLGITVAEKFSNRLPFLFKVLAAEKPLSIQAHPNRQQAAEGFSRENKKGIPLDSQGRVYKDQNHKPEIICALTPFHALKGFRRNKDIIDLMTVVDATSAGLKADLLKGRPQKEGLKDFFKSLLTMDKGRQKTATEIIMRKSEEMETAEPAFYWMQRLYREYPGDIGILSPLFLNIISLKPNEALYIDAGELHAYLEGAGLELMANSDNVIRGGLTPKHIDVAELINILDFTSREPRIILPEDIGNNEAVYSTGNEEFVLSIVRLKREGNEGSSHRASSQRSAEIIICTEGKAEIKDLLSGESLEISKGMTVFIPAAVKEYVITGAAVLYKAATPLPISRLS